jgi:hypothetical protein
VIECSSKGLRASFSMEERMQPADDAFGVRFAMAKAAALCWIGPVCGLHAALLAQGVPAGVPTVREIVRQQESVAAFLRGRGTSVLVRRGPGGEERLGETTASYVFETKPGGRFRIDTEPETAAWYLDRADVGPKCFTVNHNTYGFDGSVSWLWHRLWMEEDKPGTRIPMTTASVKAGRNHIWQHCPPTAWRRTLPGFYSFEAMSFTEGLAIAGTSLDVQWNAADETLVLNQPSRDGARVDRWFLPKRWAYCLARHEEREVASDRVIEFFQVLEAVKLHDAFWYPTHIKSERLTPKGTMHLEVHVAEIAIAQPDPAEFEPRFPAGTTVADLETGEHIRVAAPAGALAAPAGAFAASAGGRAADLGKSGVEVGGLVLYEPASSFTWWKLLVSAFAAAGGVFLLRGHQPRIASRPRRRVSTGRARAAFVDGKVGEGKVRKEVR